jgi:hypothetical protein
LELYFFVCHRGRESPLTSTPGAVPGNADVVIDHAGERINVDKSVRKTVNSFLTGFWEV